MKGELHWADQAALQIIKDRGDKDSYTVAAGITPSGVVHIGNFREIITQELIARALEKMGKKVRFLYSWDDFDTFRKIPKDAPKQDMLKDYLRMPITQVPDPWEDSDSYARHNQTPVEEVLPKVGINPEFIYQHKKYMACDYMDGVITALKNTEKLRKMMDKHRKDPLPDDWLPVLVYDKDTWKDTVKNITWDGKFTLEYEFEGEKKSLDMRKDGFYKLPWRIDWPMRWDCEKVDFESAGKDHATQGGSFDTGDPIQEKIWGTKPPTHLMYNFIRIKGGPGKMSSSEGGAVRLQDVLEIYTPEVARYLFTGTRPSAEFAIAFDLDILQKYDEFDRIERIFFGTDEAGNEKELENATRIYELSMPFPEKTPKKQPFQPGIRHLTNLVQLYPDEMERVLDYFKDDVKTDFDKERLLERAKCALNWVQKYAPDSFKFQVQTKVPKDLDISADEKKALKLLADRLDKKYDEQTLFEEFYNICKESGVNNKDFFKAAYKVLIAKEKGPKLATLILEIGPEKVQKLLRQT